jgi:hypothetical protein
MSKPAVGGWLRGTVVRKGGPVGSSGSTRQSTPQVQSTSSTVFGGGVKDPSGRTAEFFVRLNYQISHSYKYHKHPYSLKMMNAPYASQTAS